MSKVSKIDQIHLRAVMLCMSKTSKMYIKGVLRNINTRDQSNVEGVEDRSNTPKGCNAMYVSRDNTMHGVG